MYLRGSKWSYSRRKKRSNPWRIIALVVLVGAALYINQVVVPATSPLFIPTPTPTRPPESYVTEAERMVSEGKLPSAIETYNNAIQADPKNAANFVALAKIQVDIGDYQSAVTNAENALLINSNNSMALAVRGWALGFLGDYLQAESSLNKAIEIDPNNATAYSYKAEVIVYQIQNGKDSLGALENAIEASRIAQELSPNLMETHRARGFVLEQTANYEEAVREFEAAVAQNPNVADLHIALGRNYRLLEQYDKAVEEFNRANGLNPTDPLPLTYISRTYATVGEYAKGIQYGQQAININPTDPFLYGNLGVMYYRNRDYPNAVDNLRMAVRGGIAENGDPVEGLALDYARIAEYYYIYGLALARQGECGEALQISQLVINGVPNDEIAVYNAQEMVTICQEAANAPAASSTSETSTETPADQPTSQTATAEATESAP